MVDLEDIFTNPVFHLLGGGAVIATAIGYIMGKRMGFPPFPAWQLIILIIGEIAAAAFFASS
jgi:sorbitol-specific phosphotransferase system component IIBC